MSTLPVPFDPTRTYAHVVDGRAELVEGGVAFWQSVDPRFERGQLVCAFDIAQDTGWEMHPAGDELRDPSRAGRRLTARAARTGRCR